MLTRKIATSRALRRQRTPFGGAVRCPRRLDRGEADLRRGTQGVAVALRMQRASGIPRGECRKVILDRSEERVDDLPNNLGRVVLGGGEFHPRRRLFRPTAAI